MNLSWRIERLESERKKRNGSVAVEAFLRKFDEMSDTEIDTAISNMSDAELNTILAALGN